MSKNWIEQTINRLRAIGLARDISKSIIKGDTHTKLSKEQTLALVSFETPGLLESILGYTRPLLIRGARIAVDRFARWLVEGVEEGVTLYTSGARALFLTTSETAPLLCETLISRYNDELKGLPCTATWLPISPYELVHGPQPLKIRNQERVDALARIGITHRGGGGFGGCLQLLRQRAVAAEKAPRAHPFIGPDELQSRCPICQCRPRMSESENCALCTLFESLGAEYGHMNQGFESAISPQMYFSKNLHRTSEPCAFIVIKGVGCSDFFYSLSTIEQFNAFATFLEDTFSLTVQELPRWGLPEELLLAPFVQDDTLYLITPGAWITEKNQPMSCLHLANRILARVEKATTPLSKLQAFSKKEYKEKIATIGARAGIAITSCMTVSAGFGIARMLNEAADDIIRDDSRTAVDFIVLKTRTRFTAAINVLRKPTGDYDSVWFPFGGKTIKLRLTQRPYTRSDLEALLKLCDQIRAGEAGLQLDDLLYLKNALLQDPQTAFLIFLHKLSLLSPAQRDRLGINLYPSGMTALAWWAFQRLNISGITDLSQHEWGSAVIDMTELLQTLLIPSSQSVRQPGGNHHE